MVNLNKKMIMNPIFSLTFGVLNWTKTHENAPLCTEAKSGTEEEAGMIGEAVGIIRLGAATAEGSR